VSLAPPVVADGDLERSICVADHQSLSGAFRRDRLLLAMLPTATTAIRERDSVERIPPPGYDSRKIIYR